VYINCSEKFYFERFPLILFKCTRFGNLILRKIIKIVAIACHIFKLKCTKSDFGWTPFQTPLRYLQRSPLVGFGAHFLKMYVSLYVTW